jgi:hypothetical protein
MVGLRAGLVTLIELVGNLVSEAACPRIYERSTAAVYRQKRHVFLPILRGGRVLRAGKKLGRWK